MTEVMSEQVHTRVVAGSLSGLSALTVMAVILGVSVVAGHLLPPTGAGASAATVRISEPTASGAAASVTAAPAVVGPAARAFSRSSTATSGSRGTTTSHHHHRGHPDGGGPKGCGRCGHHPGSSGTTVNVSAGPANATVTAGDHSVEVSAGAGPVHVHRKVKTPVSVDETVCTLLSC
jgi:hypothetical protein